ncbi:TLC domain-containing protein [Colletotrichum abscissum]|uniref:TLC domain-containing protein n=1 Tax=Colletotrichum abscissum TaxID=1671311 RepID=A0A9P9XEH4_9PEZI|nr:TLC domain-containing protein [Colletotrichum abscissum]KAI3548978.1 TLC domain-containing protein [Colletotrichum abscissum]KAK1492292.1 TLC domain-containing protein [Colletotrichum abscissum]
MSDTTSNNEASSPTFEKPVRTSSAGPQIQRNASTKQLKLMNGPLYQQGHNNVNVVLIRRVRRTDDSAWKMLSRWMVENQVGLSFNLLALLFLAHFFIPKAQPHTTKFFTLSYYNQETGQYGAGLGDSCLLAFCIILFTGLRAATMEYVLAPLAKGWGIKKRKDLTRFSEQAWLLVYYMVFWPLGMYIYKTSPYWLNLRELWTNWPQRELSGLNKFYILAQWAFWLQQILVINIEDRRKDHWQMFTHHIITCTLISACYSYHQTRVGNLILVLMDVVDLFFPLAKCLKYVGLNTLCDFMFGAFVLSWLIARHVFYLMVCWSIHTHIPEEIPDSCYTGQAPNLVGPLPIPEGKSWMLEPFYKSDGIVCWDSTIRWAFLIPLLALQLITIGWFFMILRVVNKVLRGGNAEDVRSDDELEGEEEGDYVYEEEVALEEEVGVEDIDLKSWERRTGIKRQASSSGVSLPGHSDRKELLGRIGCEKQVD